MSLVYVLKLMLISLIFKSQTMQNKDTLHVQINKSRNKIEFVVREFFTNNGT